MTMTCVEATPADTCINCGRTFSSKELVLADPDGDLTCSSHCWRRRPAKQFPARVAVPTDQAIGRGARTPVVERIPKPVDTSILPSGVLGAEIAEFVRELKEGKR